MAHGIFIDGRRPKSKKQLKEAVAENPASVRFENTSMHGGSDHGVDDAPDGLTFVGPDPYTKRNFYGSISRKNGKVSVK